jgi:hypothetical protein
MSHTGGMNVKWSSIINTKLQKEEVLGIFGTKYTRDNLYTYDMAFALLKYNFMQSDIVLNHDIY